jgi:hypothetical protein
LASFSFSIKRAALIVAVSGAKGAKPDAINLH